MKRTLLLLLSLCLLCLLPLGVGATVHTVQVMNFKFSPSSLPSVQVGDTIQWVWASGTHTITSGSIPAGAAPWDAQINASSPSFTYVPTVPGTYNYHCAFHGSMQASFVVQCPATPGKNFTYNTCTDTITIGSPAPFYTSWTALPSGSTTGPGNYTLATTFQSGKTAFLGTYDLGFGCTATDTFTVNRVAPPTFSTGPDQTVCGSDSVFLQASFSGISASKINWKNATFGYGLTTDTTDGSASDQVPQPGLYRYVAFYTDFANHCFVYDTLQASVVDTQSVMAFAGQDRLTCGHDTLMLQAVFPDPLLSYGWTALDAKGHVISGNNTPDALVYVTGDSARFQLTASLAACAVSASDTVMIFQSGSLLSVTLGPDAALCPGDTLWLDATDSSATTYAWSTGEFTAQIGVSGAGTYSVIVTNNFGCQAMDTVNISLKPGPALFIPNYEVGLCGSDNATLRADNYGGNADNAYTWTALDANGTVDSTAGNDTLSLAYIRVNSAGVANFEVMAVDTVTGCSYTDTLTATKYDSISVAIMGPDSICGASGYLTAQSVGGADYAWSTLSGGGFISSDSSVSDIFIAVGAGKSVPFAVMAMVGGCLATDTVTVTSFPDVTAAFTYAPSGMTLSFQNQSQNMAQSFWDFGDGTTSISINPQHTYTVCATYKVRLISSGASGLCLDSTFQLVNVNCTTAAQDMATQASLTVYPNPASRLLNVETKGMQTGESFVLTLTDATGRCVLRQPMEAAQAVVDVSALPQGIYALTLEGRSGGKLNALRIVIGH